MKSSATDIQPHERTAEVVIELIGVSKAYKDVLALNNVSFTINKGDIFGYIGPNGAGKTTTIKILVGLISDFQGHVTIQGQSIRDEPSHTNLSLGYLPQFVGFQEWRTVNHALATFGLLSGVRGDYLEARIQEILSLLNLSDVRHRKIAHLSGGMQQKLALAQALLHEPQVLVLDEPIKGLDPASRHQIKQTIKSLAKSGTTVLFSSHILSDVQDIATKIGILNRGEIVKLGTPEELQDDFRVGDDIEIVLAPKSPLCEGLTQLSGVESVEVVASNRQLVHLESNADVDKVMEAILRTILTQNVKVLKIQLLQPSLEEVYLQLVGDDTI
ncbi:MAG: ATP-binding cassette domain-containing protein [Candidatus Hodarchaeota archaeon]